jgi:hypothetical protein
MKRFLFAALAALLAFLPAGAYSQTGDDFGFGSQNDRFGFDSGPSPTAAPAAGPGGVKISGEVSAEFLGFPGAPDSWSSIKTAELGDVFSGALNFSASGSAADAVINLNLAPTASPVSIDEAYARVYFGPVNIEGGLRKLTWGRADSFGPLDVINPLDYTDLTKISDPLSVKLARPMLHISWGIGNFSKLEGVFVPGFQGHRFDLDGRWAPSQITGLADQAPLLAAGLKANLSQNPATPPAALPGFIAELDTWAADFTVQKYYWSDNASLQYAQAGLRFATVIGSSDFGAQYYYGRLPHPALSINLDGLVDAAGLHTDRIISMDYNSYHQIGLDYAVVVAGFNTRAEAAVNITEDLEGDRPDIYNPSVAWSLGFDRDVVAGINVNLQAVETIRLFHDKIEENTADTEDGKDITSTRLTLILSKKFLRDKLELRAVGLWDIEETGFLIMPGIAYSNNDVTVELKCGLFGGEEDGELGQYRDNHFVRAALTYSF